MSDIIQATALKAQKIVELSEIIDDYIDSVGCTINYKTTLKAVHKLMQPHQETTFLLYFNEARSQIRKDIRQSIAEYYARCEFTTMLDNLSHISVSQIIYTKLISQGIPQKIALKIALSIYATDDEMDSIAELDESHIYGMATKDINHLIAHKEREYLWLRDKFELQYNTFVNSLRQDK